MISFLSSIWLWGVAALAIPVLIHLLNRGQGKRIKISSLRFLRQSRSKRIRRLKLNDLPLLLLRMLIIALLVFLLAEPVFVKRDNAAAEAPDDWILVHYEHFGDHFPPASKRLIDSLVAAGAELRLLAKNFPQIEISELTETIQNPENLWSRLLAADEAAPLGVAFYVFTSKRLANFDGKRPRMARDVFWHFLPSQAHLQWIQRVRRFADDSLLVEIGASDSASVWFANYKFAFPDKKEILTAPGLPPLSFEPEKPTSPASLSFLQKNTGLAPKKVRIEPEFSPTKVAIFHRDERREDAAYVRAAVEAAAEQNLIQIDLKIHVISESPAQIPTSGLIFWLAAQPLPQKVFQEQSGDLLVITDASSKRYESVEGEIVLRNPATIAHPKIRRRAPLTSKKGEAVWVDANGAALLERVYKNGVVQYQFASRFHPSWTDLPLEAAFPKWVESLLLEHMKLYRKVEKPLDLRTMDVRQIQPDRIEKRGNARPSKTQKNLYAPLWLLIAFIFMAERLFSVKSPQS